MTTAGRPLILRFACYSTRLRSLACNQFAYFDFSFTYMWHGIRSALKVATIPYYKAMGNYSYAFNIDEAYTKLDHLHYHALSTIIRLLGCIVDDHIGHVEGQLKSCKEVIIFFFISFGKSARTMRLVSKCSCRWRASTDMQYSTLRSWIEIWPWHDVKFRFLKFWVIQQIFRTVLTKWTQWWYTYSSIPFI